VVIHEAMSMWAVSMSHKSYWDKLRRERFRDIIGTLGGDGFHIMGLTTLINNGALVMSRV
jgi:hypothetical protein